MPVPTAKPKQGHVDGVSLLRASAAPFHAQNDGYAPGDWPSAKDVPQPVAVGFSTEHLHNRLQVSQLCLQSWCYRANFCISFTVPDAKFQATPGLCSQSRPQSASAHKRKGWHALQQGTAPQPGHTGRQSNSSAVYVRPDRTVNTNIALDNSPSFPSLANFADALPTSHTMQPANVAHASKQNPWASPSGKQNTQQTNSPASGAAASKPAQRYSAALSPAKAIQEEPQSKLSRGMAMSDSELTNITSLLSTHPWAEPGLARVSLPCRIIVVLSQ